MDRKRFIEQLFARAKEAGFEACDALISEEDSFDTNIIGGEIVEYNVSSSLGLGFRGLKDGKMGCSSTQVLDEDAIDLLVDGAMDNLLLIESEDRQFIYPGDSEYVNIETYTPELDEVSAAEKIDLAKQLEKLALARDPRVKQVEAAGVQTSSSRTTIVNSLGLNLSRRKNWACAYVVPVVRDGEKAASGMAFRAVSDLKLADPEAIAAEAVQKALDELDASSCDSAAMRILLRPEAARSFLSTFMGVFSADNAQKGMSLLKGREGEKIAADCVTLRDDPHMIGGYASRGFDCEGVATAPRNIIDGGTLTTLLHSLKTAHKQGVKSTGNGLRGTSGGIAIAPSNVYIQPSDLTDEEMLARLGDGLIITDVTGLHAGADTISGDFSLSAKGARVRGGKIREQVKQVTVAGNFYTMLKDIEAVGSDLRFGFPGSVYTGSPSLLVKTLSVAGK